MPGRSQGGPIDRGLLIGSLPALALVLLCALHPIEIHPEAAAGAGILLALTALVLPRLDAGRPLSAVLGISAWLAPVAGLALALSCAPHASALVTARTVFLVILGIALAGTARARGGAALLATTAAAIGVLASLYAVWQGFAGFASQARAAELLPGPLRELILARLGSGRVFGPFLLPASLGGALAITLPFTVALAVAAVGRRRLGWMAGSLVQVVALLWTISLGAWIALASSAAIVFLVPLMRARRGRWVLATGAGLVVLVVVAGLFARSRLLPAPGPEDRPLGYRSGNWVVATSVIADHPLFGTGPGTFGEVFPAYRREGMNESRYAHCTYLQLVAELGIGVVPFLALVPLGAAGLVRRAREGGAIGLAAAVGAVAFLVQNLVDFTFYQPSVGALFVLAAAVAACARTQETTAPVAPGVGWRTGHVIVLASSILVGVFLGLSGMSDLARERAVLAHERGSSQEASLLVRAIRLDPFDPEPRGDLAEVLALAAARDLRSVPAGDATASGSARPNATREGASARGTETLRRALEEARAAAALDPRTAFRRNTVARIEVMSGHPAAAWIELTRAVSLYPLKSDYRRDVAELERTLFARGAPATEDR